MNVQQFTPFEEKVWLCSPTMHKEELEFVTHDAFEANMMATSGENLTEVERLTAEATGCKYAVALSSGTAALHLAMKLAGVKPGMPVLCSDLTFSATVNPVVYEGGVPVFIDAEYATWDMDPIALEEAFDIIDSNIVVVAHLYGNPCRMDEIRTVCDKHGAVIVEDAAESLGASYKGKQTGSFGKYGVISFNGNKIITGSAGGCLVTDDKEAAEKARKWSNQSREDAPWYQHEEIGYNYRMSNVIAGVVRGQYQHLDEHIEKKKEIYERYQEGFKDLPVSMNPAGSRNSCSNYWLSCLLINPEAMCEQVRGERDASYVAEHGKTCPTEILETLDKYNVEGRPIWKPMHMQPLFEENKFVTCKGCEYTKTDANNGLSHSVDADIFNRGLCLPSDIKMTAEEQNKVIEIVRSCFD